MAALARRAAPPIWLLGAWTPASAPWQWRLLRYTPLDTRWSRAASRSSCSSCCRASCWRGALVRSPLSYGRYAVRRVARIYVPFAAAILLSAACYALLDPADPRPFSAWFASLWRGGWSAPTLLGHLAMPGTGRDDLDPVIWSLVQELRISLALPALLWLARRGFFPLLLASMALQLAVPEGRPFWGTGVDGSLTATSYFICFFVLGIGLALHTASLPARPRLPMLAAALALLCGAAGANDLAYGAGALLLLAVVVGVPDRRSWLEARPLLWLGRVSYSLYLVHLPVFLVVIHALHPPAACLPLLVPASLLVAWAFNRLVERPAQRLGAALTARRYALNAAVSVPR